MVTLLAVVEARFLIAVPFEEYAWLSLLWPGMDWMISRLVRFC